MRLKFHRNRQNNWKTHPIHRHRESQRRYSEKKVPIVRLQKIFQGDNTFY